MHHFIAKLRAIFRGPTKRPARKRQTRLSLESLEGRELMSASALPPAELSQALVSVASPKITVGTSTTVTLTVKSPAQGDGGLLVPAYAYPTPGGVWDQLATAAKSVHVEAILNPNSGPGSGPDANYTAAVSKLHAAGGTVIGYVPTNYAQPATGQTTAQLVQSIEQEINDYHTWYHVDGIFLDEMATSQKDVGFYQQLYNYVHSLQSSWTVVGNPGTTPSQSYLTTRTADTLVTYEDSGSNYATAAPPSWQANYAPQQFANIVYDVTSAATMQADVNLAATRNVGWIYVTDQNLPNPYGALPSYWSQLVAAAAASPALTVHFGLGAGQSGGSFGPVTNHGNGVFTAVFTGTTAGSATTITATLDNQAVTSSMPTITVASNTPPKPVAPAPTTNNNGGHSSSEQLIDDYFDAYNPVSSRHNGWM